MYNATEMGVDINAAAHTQSADGQGDRVRCRGRGGRSGSTKDLAPGCAALGGGVVRNAGRHDGATEGLLRGATCSRKRPSSAGEVCGMWRVVVKQQ
ncbi:hypothetical protein DVH05_015994 [Phytophthora capsici]|nr:hypothetical protein DVH05_015994 [Phytophthora capsici]